MTTNTSKYEVVQIWMTGKENRGRRGNHFMIQEMSLRKSRVLMDSSEMSRILQSINPENLKTDGSEYPFVRDLIVLDIGKAVSAYEDMIIPAGGVIYLNDVAYKIFICADGHVRNSKALFARLDIWDQATRILCCGMNTQEEYLPSKLHSYLGKAATPSTPIALDELPNMIVLPDCKVTIPGQYDVVSRDVKSGRYRVNYDQFRKQEINLFDGAGIIDYAKALEFAQKLGLDYVPSAFQIRLSPGVKGCLFTFPIKEFWKSKVEGRERKQLIDAWGDTIECVDDLDIVLTESQFKLRRSFPNFKAWKDRFLTPNDGYRYTFNISNVSPKPDNLDDTVKLSYQPLQTIELTDQEIVQLAERTVNKITNAYKDPDELLSCLRLDVVDEEEQKYVLPPYFRALKHNKALLKDEFIQHEVREELKKIKERAYLGKLEVPGCYMHMAPDLFALAEYVFGLEPRGLLEAGECYADYWNVRQVRAVDTIRFPHLRNEHCIMTCHDSEEASYWYRHQKSTLILNVHDTTAMKLGGADFDGDTALTTSDPVMLEASGRHVSRTVIQENCEESDGLGPRGSKDNIVKCGPYDTVQLMKADCTGMRCNIGVVANQNSVIWSAKKSQLRDSYITIMYVVGSDVIDSVKTGMEVVTPEDVFDFYDRIPKPHFLGYKNHKDWEKYCGDQPCTMNRICGHLEQSLNRLKLNYDVPRFSYRSLMRGPESDMRGKRYTALRDELMRCQKEYDDLCKKLQGKHDSWAKYQYDAFFCRCRHSLKEICSDTDKLIDILIQLYYADEKLMEQRYTNKKILWQSFEDEMLERARTPHSIPEDNVSMVEERKAKKRRKRQNRKMDAKIQDDKIGVRRQIPVYDTTLEQIVNIARTQDERVFLAGLEILSREQRDDERDPIAFKSKSHTELTESFFAKTIQVDPRKVEKILSSLKENGAITDKYNTGEKLINVQLDILEGKVLYTVKSSCDFEVFARKWLPKYLKDKQNMHKKSDCYDMGTSDSLHSVI